MDYEINQIIPFRAKDLSALGRGVAVLRLILLFHILVPSSTERQMQFRVNENETQNSLSKLLNNLMKLLHIL